MKKMKSFFRNLWKNESGQGMTEYAMLILVVVAIAFIFKDKIRTAVQAKMEEVSGKISDFKGDN